jgi:hypothetical protein
VLMLVFLAPPDARRLWNDRKAIKPNTDYTD